MQIKINTKQNQKLLQNYPEDPYSDLVIITKSRRLNLVLAYLAIDSKFFDDINPDAQFHQIDLSHLSEQPLLRVIRSLYGQCLIARSIQELKQLYIIIRFLKIHQYKENIQKQIMSKPDILQLIQFLQFSFKNQLLVDQVIQFHISNKLKLLQNNRNYLQLNKITNESFKILLIAFIEKLKKDYDSIQNVIKQPQAQIVNHVMENYFNRNNIKSSTFFKETQLIQLQTIWHKFHHRISFQEQTPSVSMGCSQFLGLKSEKKLRKKSEQIQKVNVKQMKKKRICDLQQEIKQKDSIIAQLEAEVSRIKPKIKKIGIVGKNSIGLIMQNQQNRNQDEISMSFLQNMKKNKKSKEYQSEEDFTVSSVFQPAFDKERKIPQFKQVKTMKKAGQRKFW